MGFIKMEKNEIKELYSMLNNVNTKLLHEYKLEIISDGINLYSINSRINTIYNLHSLVRKVFKVTPFAIFYIDFKNKYLRIL